LEQMAFKKWRLRVLTAGVVMSSLTFASQSNAIKAETGRKVYCERLLTRKNTDLRTKELVAHYFGHPFTIFMVHSMKEAGKQKFGFHVDVNDEDLRNMILIASPDAEGRNLQVRLGLFRGFKFIIMLKRDFSDPQLTGFQPIQLPAGGIYSYHHLIHEYAAPVRSSEPDIVGYQSAVDADGVRHFVAFSEGKQNITEIITMGIDVPCEKATLYTGSVDGFTDEIRSPDGSYCRIPVMTFARND
jgi:hypothetical protein